MLETIHEYSIRYQKTRRIIVKTIKIEHNITNKLEILRNILLSLTLDEIFKIQTIGILDDVYNFDINNDKPTVHDLLAILIVRSKQYNYIIEKRDDYLLKLREAAHNYFKRIETEKTN